jgi:hypothetical protein
MIVKINPTFDEQGSGCTSQVSWSNPDTLRCLNQLFGINSYEKITQLEVNSYGLTARIEQCD